VLVDKDCCRLIEKIEILLQGVVGLLTNIPLVASNQYFLSLSDCFWLNPVESPKEWKDSQFIGIMFMLNTFLIKLAIFH
jgi:hypothetical protein